jgi:hypothetical protein
MTGMCVALVFAVILCILVSRVPGMVAGVVNGSSISAMSFGGVGGAMRSASGMATGAGMMMAQATGAGMALSSAYKAMQDHKANGEGSFAKGAATTGLRGMLHSATDMAANLSEGGYGARQRTTSGGMVASHIDGAVQQRQAERGKEKAEKEKLAAQGGAAGEAQQDLGAEASQSGGGDSTAPSGEEAGGEHAQSSHFDGSGTLSGMSSGGDAGGGGAPTENAEKGQGAFGNAGGFSFDYSGHDDGMDEWKAAVENYDPGKIGLPDSE